MQTESERLKQLATELKLHGLVAHWHELTNEQWPWLKSLLDWEVTERNQRGVKRRLHNTRLGRFKPLADFDWKWPEKIDQQAVHNLMQLNFLDNATNVILIGSNGVGKSTIAQNLAWQAAIKGHSALFVSAANMLNDLASIDSDAALTRRRKYYAQPQLLVIDEIGYLSYSDQHADLLFDIINRRYEQKSTVVTTNRPFPEWGEVFPNAACVVSLIDRLIHHSEILAIEGKSYRMKEAQEAANNRQKR
jgi:DNA replication protein DnaC